MWDYVGVEWIPLLCQQTLCATQSETSLRLSPPSPPTLVFSSMTSLQKEEFFDLVATAQARRLDDQRAQLGDVPAPKDDLYDMILTTQAQGRLEDQRSRAPGPMDDEDFFSLLLKVQGGRMDEQRTELPRLLKT
uniref:G protein signaling modulator 3 n=1 Tax=Xiphophorus couchianus TaxID=32473 RepID=A0A3B5L4D5_9TELE